MEKEKEPQSELTIEQKVDILGRRVYDLSITHGNALDLMYIQLISMVEILSEEKIT